MNLAAQLKADLYDADKRPYGRYLLEIFFDGKTRTINGPNLSLLTAWDRGNPPSFKGNRVQLPWCGMADVLSDDNEIIQKGSPGCGHLIPNEFTSSDEAVCPHCGQHIVDGKIITLKVGRQLTDHLAVQLEQAITDCKFDVDVLVHNDPIDRRVLLATGRPITEDLRERDMKIVYTRQNMMKDIQSGADIYGRLKAFLRAG